MIKIFNFEKSFYKFIKEDYADIHSYPVYYGNLSIDIDKDDIWLYCKFSELNVDTGHFSLVFIDIITKISSVDSYNSQLTSIVDDLKELLTNADIDLFDFSDLDNPVLQENRKLLIRSGGRPVFERVEEQEFAGLKSLLQSSHITFKVKALENFARKRIV